MTTRFTNEPQPTGKVPTSTDGGAPVRVGPLLAGLLGLLTVCVLLIARWGSPDRPLTLAAAGLMPLIAPIPLAIGAIGSWFSRSKAARVAAAVVMAVFLYTTSPVDAVLGCRTESDRPARSDDTITVYSANVFFDTGGGRPTDVARSIVAQQPDIVVLQEVKSEFLVALQAEPGLAELAHRTNDVEGMTIDEVIWSRWPLEDVVLRPVADQRFIDATVVGPGGTFTVTAVHTQAPVDAAEIGRWKSQLAALEALDSASPRMMAGDFNATMDHRPFRSLVNSGWTDVHERKGCGLDNTWPVDQGLPFPVMRLDHVLVTDHFEVLDLRFGDPAGSDHLPVVTTLELTGR